MTEPILISTEYTLVIDTNRMSLPFINKLCAYCTGVVDEDDSELEYSQLFYLETGLEDDDSAKGRVAEEKSIFYGYVAHKEIDQVYSPCTCWLNKRYGYSTTGEYALLTEDNYDDYNFPAPMSVGIFFDLEPQPEHINLVRQRAEKFFKEVWPKIKPDEPVEVEGLRLIVHTKYAKEIEL